MDERLTPFEAPPRCDIHSPVASGCQSPNSPLISVALTSCTAASMQRRSNAAGATWWRSPWRRTEQWLQRRINGASSGGGTGSGTATTDLGIILAYGLGALPLALLNNIWVTYVYVFFISGPLRDSALFLLVQAVFLLWNSVNDPLFGWSAKGQRRRERTHIWSEGRVGGGEMQHSSSHHRRSPPPLCGRHSLSFDPLTCLSAAVG